MDGEFPRGWRIEVIKPIPKGGNDSRVENYRITLAHMLYKIYAMVIGKRLKEETEMKGMLSDYQAGFRNGRNCTDNLYVHSFIIESEIAEG